MAKPVLKPVKAEPILIEQIVKLSGRKKKIQQIC
jgi:hypothetical protein